MVSLIDSLNEKYITSNSQKIFNNLEIKPYTGTDGYSKTWAWYKKMLRAIYRFKSIFHSFSKIGNLKPNAPN